MKIVKENFRAMKTCRPYDILISIELHDSIQDSKQMEDGFQIMQLYGNGYTMHLKF